MDAKNQLTAYLEATIGSPVTLRPVDSRRLTGLPALFVLGIRLYEMKWLAQRFIVADASLGQLDIPPREIAARQRRLAGQLQCPVIYVFPTLDSYRRNRLVQMGVPFIVPGHQFFLPPLISLIERAPHPEPRQVLSAPAQLAILYQLLRQPPDGSLLSRWAEWMRYSVMTLSKVRGELVASDLCALESGERPRGLRFRNQGRDLWEAARPRLKSPVRCVRWADFGTPPPHLLKAGPPALATQTMLNDSEPPSYACLAAEWRGLVKAGALCPAEHAEAASVRVECWRYDPAILGRDCLVDPLSLYLSVTEDPDERIRLSADELLEKVAW